MRALAYAFLLSAWALSGGCVGAPKPKDWLAVGFRSPEQTSRTFQTGLRAGFPELEYRCLGAAFKRRAAGEMGAFSLLGYVEFRRELFRAQPQPYRDEVLGDAPRIAVEAAIAQPWYEWLRPGDKFIGLSDFGVSAPGPKVFEHFGLTAAKVADAARALAKKA